MTVTSDSTHAAAIGRFKRLAGVTSSKGMRVSVDGAEIRAILAVLEATVARAEAAEAGLTAKPTRVLKPKPGGKVEVSDDVRGVLLAVDEILRGRPELWAKPLRESLTEWCAGTGVPIAAEWLALLDE